MSMSVPAGVLHESKHSEGMTLVMATTAPDETVTIPCQNVGTFNASIDWGDGSSDQILTYDEAQLVHEYALAGDHTIRICGRFPNIYFNNTGDKLKLKEIVQLGDTGLTRLDYAFFGCANLTSVGGAVADTSAVTTMRQMFHLCTELAVCDTSGFDTSEVTNMYAVFHSCVNLITVDVSSWDTSKVNNMVTLFYDCYVLADAAVDAWNVESVTTISDFMRNVTLPTSRYDATLIAWAAQAVNSDLEIDFGLSKYTPEISGEARSKLKLTDGWDITDDGPIHDDMTLLMATTGAAEWITIPCINYNTFDAVIDWGDGEADSIITAYDDPDLAHEYADAGDHVIRISGTFPNIGFNNGGDKLKLKKVYQFGDTGLTRLSDAFWGCINLTDIYGDAVNTSGVITFRNLFYNCSSLVIADVSNFNTAAATDMANMFLGCSSLTQLDLTNFNTDIVVDLGGMLQGCSALIEADVGGFNTSECTDFASVFRNCSALEIIDVSGWNVTKGVLLNSLFFACEAVVVLDVSGWVTTAATKLNNLFINCHQVVTLDLSGFDTSEVTTLENMFYACSALIGIDVSGFDTSKVTTIRQTFRYADLLTDLAIDSWNIEVVANTENFMTGNPGLNTARYDATLIAWAAQDVVDSLAVNFGGSLYTAGGAAEAARQSLVDDDLWTIIDGGAA